MKTIAVATALAAEAPAEVLSIVDIVRVVPSVAA